MKQIRVKKIERLVVWSRPKYLREEEEEEEEEEEGGGGGGGGEGKHKM